MAGIVEAELRLARRVRYAMAFHFDRDGSTVNDRCIDFRIATLLEELQGVPVVFSQSLCANHDNNIIEAEKRVIPGFVQRSVLTTPHGKTSYWEVESV